MLKKSTTQSNPQTNLFTPVLASFINQKHELVVLSQKINWIKIETDLVLFYSKIGAPAKPIRLMAGLLILKQMFNKSDEVIVEDWKQNPYYQFFTGGIFFQWEVPCDPSDLAHFRKRIGEEGIRTIFQVSLELHEDKISKAKEVIIDTTVQEKNITFPTDTKMALKIIEKTLKFAVKQGVKLKQTFSKELKDLKIKMRFAHHVKRKKEAYKARKRIKTIAGILVRELGRKEDKGLFEELKGLYLKILDQKRNDKDKIYSLHELHVACIAKGKSHKPYEFGSKISISTLPKSNVVVDVSHFEGNPNDSKTLDPVLKSIKLNLNKTFDYGIVDRGYRGKKKIEDTNIVYPDPKEDRTKNLEYQLNKSRQCRSRAAIEPVISHLKYDCRMLRCYLKGVIGDKINALMAGAAYNFRITLREIRAKISFCLNFIRFFWTTHILSY